MATGGNESADGSTRGQEKIEDVVVGDGVAAIPGRGRRRSTQAVDTVGGCTRGGIMDVVELDQVVIVTKSECIGRG